MSEAVKKQAFHTLSVEVENKRDRQQAVGEDEPGMFAVATNPRLSPSKTNSP